MTMAIGTIDPTTHSGPLFEWAASFDRRARNRRNAPKANAAARGARSDQWGRAAEEVAARWYEAKGGEVLARRWRSAAGEVDLVVSLGGRLSIIEVKARNSVDAALRAVSPRDWRRLAQKAELCAEEFKCRDVRIDIAALGRDGRMQVVENAGMEAAFA